MDFELYAQAHLTELRRLAESCGQVTAARRAARDDECPGRFARFGLRVVEGFAWAMPPITEHSDPWYPWWWEG